RSAQSAGGAGPRRKRSVARPGTLRIRLRNRPRQPAEGLPGDSAIQHRLQSAVLFGGARTGAVSHCPPAKSPGARSAEAALAIRSARRNRPVAAERTRRAGPLPAPHIKSEIRNPKSETTHGMTALAALPARGPERSNDVSSPPLRSVAR